MSVTEQDRERAAELYVEAVDGTQVEALGRIAQALADERRNALLRASDRLRFTPLSERESGELSDYTQGIHAAAQLVALMAEDDQ